MVIKRRFEDIFEGRRDDKDVARALPIGDPIRVTKRGKKKKKKNHYSSFEYYGNVYNLEDMVLLGPEKITERPYVAIIKDIADSSSGLMVTGQWFYRPEEAIKKGGGTWKAQVDRELFYSFHLDVVPAESIMHKCVVHFVPLYKQLPPRSEYPGFVVRKVYDTFQRILRELTDTDFEKSKKAELDQLVKRTIRRIGELPDIEPEGNEQLLQAENPASCPSNGSEYHTILAKFKALTGDLCRDNWLEKLLQGVQQACEEIALEGNREKSDMEEIFWPDSAVAAVSALEKAFHETFDSDFQEYNDKMQLLDFNVKNNALLARHLLNKEWDPEIVYSMSPNALKEYLTAHTKSPSELVEPEDIQMTNTQCLRCKAKQVAIADVIHDGGLGNRYQLECQACGCYWYASGDAISSLF